jgi:hypothetical protein
MLNISLFLVVDVPFMWARGVRGVLPKIVLNTPELHSHDRSQGSA